MCREEATEYFSTQHLSSRWSGISLWLKALKTSSMHISKLNKLAIYLDFVFSM